MKDKKQIIKKNLTINHTNTNNISNSSNNNNKEDKEKKDMALPIKIKNFHSAVNSGGLNNIEQGSEVYLTEMLGFDYNDLDSDDEEEVEDDLIYLKDIDNDFVLKDYLFDFFTKFYKSDELYLT